ncbi:restriction endonuclease PLD domain-containing protein [Enterococcus faecalis]|uniref:restriction endonuclease PLD domain-containing protein n=1 Tax=Enterococcus faecalis TaxID=1351 RepID=UPI0019F2E3E1|nr:restriction endonuclease PLD domain-containing protein [Enterococcus faecalis]EGO7785646.1 NgoFVII family restriction endonuclease [Enterococcus faecalis]EGO8057460.1 NgoFVII family restriction endonuclease [Enterococcus faecalis]EGO8602079.1 NgoFVII family restriction endonuclease [Enterococcus faecalis]EGO8937718.1 NgoFVII family restriction endonuclease [Enterococcus faecalis]EHA3979958.1 NgoFVII family restriction endonuclease [Enterococcus faecalis]
MFYDKDLESIIFNMHESLAKEPDQLIIISGYLGPDPVFRLQWLPFNVTVIAGMYTGGVDTRLYSALNRAQKDNPNLDILYATRDIHSKIYIWLARGEVLTALIGSANFSSNGLRSDLRETLAVANRGTHTYLMHYVDNVFNLSTKEPVLRQNQAIVEYTTTTTLISAPTELQLSYNLPLYSIRDNEVQEKSGLNWGHSSGHTAVGDAYIAIPKDILIENQGLFEPFDNGYENALNGKARQSDPIELLWDDGYTMPASLEGTQNLNGYTYPKQLTSYSQYVPYLKGERISAKSILGRYLRDRMGVDVNHVITMEDLERYGRNNVTLSLIEPGLYYADFSVK